MGAVAVVNGNGNGNGAVVYQRWHLWVTAAGFLVILIGAALTFLLSNNNTTLLVAQHSTAIDNHNKELSTQRDMINKLQTELARYEGLQEQVKILSGRIDIVSERASKNTADSTGLKQSLVEIETQFCASDIVRNLNHAFEQRYMSMVWRKLFPEAPIPTDNTYYPMICNRNSNGAQAQ